MVVRIYETAFTAQHALTALIYFLEA